ncbi:MAG: right-handed parallel beta-helix repeat-containing protein [Candidatus Heimdallarchaeota archaeon]|nr:right-handed parallel beta-helix repeat-containing protein [Candidatus Heimdallarchaeota archaeon]
MSKLNKNLIKSVLFISSLLLCLAIFNTTTTSIAEIPSANNPINLNYVTHDPIEITSDDNFTDYGFPGEGTEINPYRIENLHIKAEVSFAIIVQVVTMNFVIQNCLIEDTSTAIFLYGLSWNSCRVEHNILTNVDTGIFVYSVLNGTILNNTIEADYTGIEVETAVDLAIVNNTIYATHWYGIVFGTDADTIITGNKFYGSGIAFGLFTLPYFDTFTIEDNLVNDKTLGYFVHQNDLDISTTDYYGQLLLYDCDRAIIRNQDLRNTTFGIQAYQCNNMTIYDSKFGYNFASIKIDYSDRLYVHNCEFKHNPQWEALRLHSCDNGYFFDNYFEDTVGFHIQGGLNVTLRGNDFVDVSLAFYLDSITHSTVYENYIFESSSGLWIYYGEFIEVYDNIFYQSISGIDVDFNNDITIHDNLFQELEISAIRLNNETENCTIYHNTFVNNNLLNYYASQAYDKGTNNLWYNETLQQGNYWSDWTSGPYDIDGDSGSQDLYPLSSPTITPFIAEYHSFYASSYIMVPILVCIIYLVKRKKKREIN